MDSLPDQTATKPHKIVLPFEIVCRIVEQFASLRTFTYDAKDTASDQYLDPVSRIELLRLRLVSKAWSTATLPFAFHTFRFARYERVQEFLENWSSSIYAPDHPCPVKRLMVKDLLYLGENDDRSLQPEGLEAKAPIFMDQVAKLIELIGIDLHDLSLEIIDGFGISSSLLKAIKKITKLKKLTLKHKGYGGLFELKSIADLLVAIPNLEFLTMDCLDLDGMELEPPALSNLRYFNFTGLTIAHLFETAKETLKIVEFTSFYGDAGDAFGPIANTLEGLFTYSVKLIPESVASIEFPKLRVFRTQQWAAVEKDTNPTIFLTWTMLHTIRTLAFDIDGGQLHLQQHLKHAGESLFHATPKLRHIVFMFDGQEDSRRSVNPELVEALGVHDIHCHVMPELKPDELLELDDKLNGPME